MIPYTEIDVSAPLASAFREHGLTFATGADHAGHPRRPDQLAAGRQPEPAPDPDGDGPRRHAPRAVLRRRPPAVQDALEVDDPGRRWSSRSARRSPRSGSWPTWSASARLFAFVIVCAAVLILRYTSPEIERPFRVPALPLVAGLGILVNGGLMFSLGRDNWIRLFVWLLIGLVIYFGYSRYHTKLGLTQ